VKVVVYSFIPSPYQVELFDTLHESGEIALTVIYAAHGVVGTPWSERSLRHPHRFIDECSSRDLDRDTDQGDLVVFSWYRHPGFRNAMRRRSRQGRPWCLWSERPGFRYTGIAGRAVRKVLLWPLWARHAPIWAIGQWGIEGYRREFGDRHAYIDLPYFSNLARFRAICNPSRRAPKRVLYVGSLIPRKGLDVLAAAWRRIAPRFPSARLSLLGSGVMAQGLARTLAPVDKSISLLGPADWEQVPQAYGTADILCAPSRYDGWGLIIPEGLASGLPVVASSSMGASREMLVEGRQGWFAEPGDVDSLERKLALALSLSADEYGAMSHAAQETARGYDVDEGSRRFTAAAHQTVADFRSPS